MNAPIKKLTLVRETVRSLNVKARLRAGKNDTLPPSSPPSARPTYSCPTPVSGGGSTKVSAGGDPISVSLADLPD